MSPSNLLPKALNLTHSYLEKKLFDLNPTDQAICDRAEINSGELYGTINRDSLTSILAATKLIDYTSQPPVLPTKKQLTDFDNSLTAALSFMKNILNPDGGVALPILPILDDVDEVQTAIRVITNHGATQQPTEQNYRDLAAKIDTLYSDSQDFQSNFIGIVRDQLSGCSDAINGLEEEE